MDVTLIPSVAEIVNMERLDVIQILGFKEMTPVQATAIPLFLMNKDVIVEVFIY